MSPEDICRKLGEKKTKTIFQELTSDGMKKVLREAYDMCRHGDFHETSLAYRLKAPIEEVHQHLELLADLGLTPTMSSP